MEEIAVLHSLDVFKFICILLLGGHSGYDNRNDPTFSWNYLLRGGVYLFGEKGNSEKVIYNRFNAINLLYFC